MPRRTPENPKGLPPDPWGVPDPHDVLAAEEFGIGIGDVDTPEARARRLPPDPTGIEAPHDVLAAEDFAIPVGAPPPDAAALARSGVGRERLVAGALAGAVALAVVLRLRRR